MLRKYLVMLALSCILGLAFAGPTESEFNDNTARHLQVLKNTKTEEANKLVVKNFLQGLVGDKDFTVIDQYVHPDYIQHLPTLADGVDALKEFAHNELPPTAPKTIVDFLRIGADGDLVFVHIKSKRNGNPLSVMCVFRVEDLLLREHWEVSAELTPEVLANAKNPHPLF